MDKTKIARVSVNVNAPIVQVWKALVTPEIIERYMMGAKVVSDWKEGSPIVWKGEWKGKSFEDKGTILRFDPPARLQYSHFSPLAGLPETPENTHTVTVQLSRRGGQTLVTLAQDNNPSEEARAHSEMNWMMMLEGLKRTVEEQPGRGETAGDVTAL